MGACLKLVNDFSPSSSSTMRDFKMELMTFKCPVNRFDGKTFSKQVFLGGLPPDVDEDELQKRFGVYGKVKVSWPGKSSSTYLFPPKGFAFLYFELDESVHRLIKGCWKNGDSKLYYPVSSLSTNKLVEVRPWKLSDSVTIVDPYFFKKQQYAAFIGGIPRRATSEDLARTIMAMFGDVSYVAFLMDSKTNYPMGSGVVLFSSYTSFHSAMKQRFVCLVISKDLSKIIEFKPFNNSHPNENHFWGLDQALSYKK